MFNANAVHGFVQKKIRLRIFKKRALFECKMWRKMWK